MGAVAILLVVAASVLVGFVYQWLDSHEKYEWAIGTVGALFGGLLANAVIGPALAGAISFDGLYIVPAFLGAILCAGLMVLGFREFGLRSAATRQPRANLEPVSTQRVRLTYTPEFLTDPVLSRISRQFGITVTVEQVEISGASGWVDVVLAGTQAGLDAALDLVRRGGFLAAPSTRSPALAAA